MNPSRRALFLLAMALCGAATVIVARSDVAELPDFSASCAGGTRDSAGGGPPARGVALERSPGPAAGLSPARRPVSVARRARLDALLRSLERAATASLEDRAVLGLELGLHLDDLGSEFPVDVALRLALLAERAPPGVRGPLRDCVERIGADPDLALAVVRELGAADADTRRAALSILGAGRAAGHVDAIAVALRTDPDPGVRAAGIAALGRIGDARSVGVLSGVLALDTTQGRTGQEARVARRALASIDNPAGLDAMAARWEELPRAAREATFEAAARRRPTPAVSARAREALAGDDVRLRCRAALVLGRTGDDEEVPQLASLLRGAETDAERAAALDALAALGTRYAAEEAMANLDGVPAEEHGRQLLRFCRIADRAPAMGWVRRRAGRL